MSHALLRMFTIQFLGIQNYLDYLLQTQRVKLEQDDPLTTLYTFGFLVSLFMGAFMLFF